MGRCLGGRGWGNGFVGGRGRGGRVVGEELRILRKFSTVFCLFVCLHLMPAPYSVPRLRFSTRCQ